ncbi:YbaB/EbfC family nucleoid-associated protein [Nocardia thailandica]|uniref:YbaB/EbfC family nucleoid-associated protein n=1 Tax=Nocardia thailandica TaxID=257275 RepID=UPI0002EE47EE|nr:YbaB/EbfC family nucleoid-associated protein [Nocardia thailandica]
MVNERAKSDLYEIMETVQEQFRQVERIQRERADIVGKSTVRKRVTVTVNADNKIIETKFGADIEDLTYPEIAKAVTEAAQLAADDVARQLAELMSPFQATRARLPKLSDLIEGMPELRMPGKVDAPLNPPTTRQDSFSDGAVARDTGSAATDSSW